ncbi:hypothetical protein WBG78_07830 [Chryseolinea sp. T2]|uniref:hypothetical protein n=1 Tax=Chryseolinea sp. T2 TaxID=3129255 RepID=UPI0030776DC8
MDEQGLIKAGILEIFGDNGFADVTTMTQRDFDHISEQLRQKSGILISGTTIKRLAYGEFSRLPQIATLNAIASYFDYKTWQDYKSDKIRNEQVNTPAREAVDEPAEAVSTSRQSITRNKAGKARALMFLKYLPAFLSVIVIAGLYFFGATKAPVEHAEKATFSFKKNTSNDIPNSVVFTYNIDSVKADSFFIQQSWDINRRVRIYKNKYTITDIYYEPGYHVAKLIANDSAIREVDVSIPTDRWFLYAIDNVAKYTPEYVRTERFADHGTLGLEISQLLENKIDITKDKRYHYVYFPSHVDIPSDNFSFKTRVRMRDVRPTTCPYIELELFCQRSFMVLRSTTKGCAHEAFMTFGEQVVRGKDTDLVPIAFDVSQWTDIEILVNNKVVTIKINDKIAYSTHFTTDTRYLTGLGYISNGLVEVDATELAGHDGKVLYESTFENTEP